MGNHLTIKKKANQTTLEEEGFSIGMLCCWGLSLERHTLCGCHWFSRPFHRARERKKEKRKGWISWFVVNLSIKSRYEHLFLPFVTNKSETNKETVYHWKWHNQKHKWFCMWGILHPLKDNTFSSSLTVLDGLAIT